MIETGPITHALSPHYPALRGFRKRKALLRSPLWREIGSEVDRVSCAVEVSRGPAADAGVVRERDRLRIAAWNLQRGARFDALAGALKEDAVLRAADVLLLVEVDVGLGRSGNRHVARDLAARLGMHYAFGAQYLTLEDDFLENAEGRENTLALAGNAILSRVPIRRVVNADLPELRDKFSSSEKRIGRKRALVAELELPDGPLVVSTCHLDSNASSAQRAHQLAAILDTIDGLSAGRALVGGDFNTTTYDVSSWFALARDLLHKLFVTGFRRTVDGYLTPELRYERPIFELLAARGLDHARLNDRTDGTVVYDFNHPYAINKVERRVGRLLTRWLLRRLEPWGRRVPARLDWFAGRGLSPLSCATVPAPRTPGGEPASDHAAIVVDLALARASRDPAVRGDG
jgi:endonuclease/exonuclease/phosphatase family metal-dependent hydrolase